ncbi:MAG: hypothetical protein CSB44_02090 [Gammaproteobacteria bacterium]|nr:MAG: hypothetical protein CSB44_02090 [Gammaproteobacteria bacterium]PIE35426.1 MAG: hypothetical protein CSA54_05615 [Gammaproteobacteria bacterium]
MAEPCKDDRNVVADISDARRKRWAQQVRGGRIINRRFDYEKVARLKAEIESGSYMIDTYRVADKLIEHERNG